jgi:DNA-binding MarR family transcriptional regulator
MKKAQPAAAPARFLAGGRPLDRTTTYRLHTLHKLTDRLSQAAYERDARVKMADGRALSAVGAFGPVSVNALAQAANLDKAQASRAAQSLVEQGLVKKAADPQDARGVVLSLTAKGQRVNQRVMAVVGQRNADIVDCLNSSERQQLDALLDKLIDAARQALA